jgi:outer membrane cobalamin receptor
MPIEKFAGNVQTMTSEEIENQNPVDLHEALYRNLGSVNINAAQNNPWQNDATNRGLLAAPLTGRGDDGNNLPEVDGYAILNLQARYAPSKHFELWGRIDNVTDADYETAGIRNFNAFSDPIAEERFLAPGAPIAGWFGVKARF